MSDPTIAAWSRESDLLFQLRQLREENERLRKDQQGVDAVNTLTEEGWIWDGDQWQRPPVGEIRALKHRIHELEGELLGYKKIVANQDAMLERQTARIVDLQTHIENFDGEDR